MGKNPKKPKRGNKTNSASWNHERGSKHGGGAPPSAHFTALAAYANNPQHARLFDELIMAIKGDDLSRVESHAMALHKAGAEVFGPLWSVDDGCGVAPGKLTILDISRGGGADRCFAWLMRLAILNGEQAAVDMIQVMMRLIESQGLSSPAYGKAIVLFKDVLRPDASVDVDTLRLMLRTGVAPTMGPRCMLNYRCLIAESIALREKAELVSGVRTPARVGDVAPSASRL